MTVDLGSNDFKPARSSDRAGALAPTQRGLRPEIQLLRAVAVLAVVTNHLVPGRVTGGFLGVDIFFVISGFLISSHLLRELDRTGRVGLAAFWARRARRLLPASLFVLLVSVLGTVLFVPQTLWSQVMREVSACALYVQNWALAQDAQDYFASANSPSPVTHYWSLSVEEQFYAVWPVLALAAYALGRRLGRPRTAVLVSFAVVVVASLGYSVWATSELPHAAYFVTPTRMWELGIGGLLAFAAPLAGRARLPLAAAGWIALLACVVLFDESAAVPGWIALLPVLAAAAVIWSGNAFLGEPAGVWGRAVAMGAWVGAISYSLYLWHWPLIVIAPYVTNSPSGLTTKAVLFAGSLALAHLTACLVEDRVRQWPRLTAARAPRTFIPAALAMVVVLAVAQGLGGLAEERVRDVQAAVEAAVGTDDCFGAAAVGNHCADAHVLRYAGAELVTMANQRERPGWGQNCQQTPMGTAVLACEFGVPRAQASRRVALVGDSHGAHWYPTLDELARKKRWNVLMMTKSSCAVNLDPGLEASWDSSLAPTCHTWVRKVVRRIAADPDIDIVFTSAISRRYRVPGADPQEQRAKLVAGFRAAWRSWTQAGKSVVVIGDVPTMGLDDIPTCVARSKRTVDPCTSPVRRALAPDPQLLAAGQADDHLILPVDLSSFFCDEQLCHSVIGGVVAYGDSNHILGYFARSLAPYLEERLASIV